jgi:menaquinone-dependent protoporphyrinogen IX oxidase
MPGAIYYKTKYGSTGDYARWLSEEVGFELKDIRKKPEIGSEPVIVIGSSLMMGKVTAKDWIIKNMEKMNGRKLVFFCVGSSKIGSQEREDILTRSLPKDILAGMKIFHLPGRIDHKRLGFFMSRLMKRFAKYEKDEVERKRAIEGYDDVKKENLAPMVAYIQGLDRSI